MRRVTKKKNGRALHATFLFLPPVQRSCSCGELGTPEFVGHPRQISMTRATVKGSTTGLGQTLRTGRPLVRWVILPWRLETKRNSGSGHGKAADAGLGRLALGDGHFAQCCDQRGPDLKHSTTTTTCNIHAQRDAHS